MTLTLTSSASKEKAIPLVKHSIEKELGYLSIGLRRTQQRLDSFQKKYGAQSPALAENLPPLDRVEWEGEEISLTKIQERVNILESVMIS